LAFAAPCFDTAYGARVPDRGAVRFDRSRDGGKEERNAIERAQRVSRGTPDCQDAVSFDSEVRIRVRRKVERTSESGH
jgi:hypothetical protein